jgi:hypothetical protein
VADGLFELADGEAAADADDAVVAAHRVEAQGERRHPDAGDGELGAADLADDDANTGHAVELLNEVRGVHVEEMVQHLGASDDVDAPVSEGEGATIADDGQRGAGSAAGGEPLGGFEADRVERDPGAGSGRTGAEGDVAQSGADVEEAGARRERWERWERGDDLGHDGAGAAEEAIGEGDVAERAAGETRVDGGVVEDLDEAAGVAAVVSG